MCELPSDDVAVAQLDVPSRARDFLDGIVRNQIDRLSPWPADQVAYGITAEPSRKDVGLVDVRVLMAARALVNTVREEIAGAGLALDRIVACPAGAIEPVVIWSRLESAAEPDQQRVKRQIATALAAMLALTVGVAAWAQISAASIQSESDELASRSAALQRQLQAGSGPAAAARNPAERAWILKQTELSSVVLLEALSRAIPDDSYATEILAAGAEHACGRRDRRRTFADRPAGAIRSVRGRAFLRSDHPHARWRLVHLSH